MDCISTIAQVFEALGTVGAVIVALVLALWGKAIQEKCFGPQLKLVLSEVEKTRDNKGQRAIHQYLKVTNPKRRSAQNVRVLLTKIETKRADGIPVAVHDRPLQLAWDPRSATSQFPSISGKGEMYCCLGFLGEGLGGFRLDTYLAYEQFPKGHIKPEDTPLRVSLEATADNCKSSPPLILEIHWDGKWEDGKMDNHFVVKPA